MGKVVEFQNLTRHVSAHADDAIAVMNCLFGHDVDVQIITLRNGDDVVGYTAEINPQGAKTESLKAHLSEWKCIYKQPRERVVFDNKESLIVTLLDCLVGAEDDDRQKA